MPSMDEILASGRKQDRRKEIVLGIVLIAGGLALTLGMRELTNGGVQWGSYGANLVRRRAARPRPVQPFVTQTLRAGARGVG